MANNEITELNEEVLESIVGGVGAPGGAGAPYAHPQGLIKMDMQKDIQQLSQLKIQDQKLDLQMKGLRNDIMQDRMALKKLS